MNGPTITVEASDYDQALSGWSIQCRIVSEDGSVRAGVEFVALPSTTTPQEILAELAKKYP
jgi:hypothetical protein